METILLVEDDDSLREVLKVVLETSGFVVETSTSVRGALATLSGLSAQCILCDFKLADGDGIELLDQVRRLYPKVPFILMTAFGSVAVAVQAIKQGATDYIQKPFDPTSLAPTLREVIRHNRIIDREAADRSKHRIGFFTQSPVCEKLLDQARHVARFDSSVLILGESGTGKEVLARYIHDHSERKDKPFIAINCAAVPADLLESEFFGHEAGAFTGATQARQGVLELASAGTIFLDEVGEMPPLLQVKLLRALQEHEIRHLGGIKEIRVHPRIIAATNRNLEEAMETGAMRDDFYYRLAVITFNLPPLRERKDDVLPLAHRCIKHFSAALGKDGVTLEPLAEDMLTNYSWPGNVRELENVIERAMLLCDKEIKSEHLGISVRLDLATIQESIRTLPEIASQAIRKSESEAIERALHLTGGNKSKAADILGVSYKTLLIKIKDYGVGFEESQGEAGDEKPFDARS